MVTMIYHIWNFYVRHPILCLWHEWVKLLSIATKISFLDKERSMCLNREICLELKLGSPHVSGVLKIYLETQYTGCPRRNVPDIGGGVFLMLKYTDITQNTYVQSWTVTEIMAREVWNFDSCYTLIDYQIHIKTGRNMWFL